MKHRSAMPDQRWAAIRPLFQVRPRLVECCLFGGDWLRSHGVEESGWSYFHIVTHGECILERAKYPPVLLKAGDVVLLPYGDAHVLRALGTRRGDVTGLRIERRDGFRLCASIDAPAEVVLVHGSALFQSIPGNVIRAALPDQMILRADSALMDSLGSIALAIQGELVADRPGNVEIASSLISVLLLMTLRSHFEDLLNQHGFPLILGPRTTQQAILAMLKEPAHKWSLDALAAVSATSRATLIRAFKKSTGLTPLAFLTALRLDLARQKLLFGQDSLAQIAEYVGYSSETALSRAFLRRFGVRPGRLLRAE
jgi:AraC family transcriptional activator of mtrCDE